MPFRFPCRCHPPTRAHCDICWADLCEHLVRHNLIGHTEPEIVYNLFFATRAVKEWRAGFSSFKPAVQYGGVFTHQKPYVSFSGQTCELADLLIVFTDLRKQVRTAVLYQAKMGRRWKPANKTQWHLLTTWPTIAYNPGPGVVSRTMPFTGRPDPGANYMLVQKTAVQVETAAANPIFSPTALADDFIAVLNRKNGRPFSWDRSSARDDWDELIWDLLNHTARTATTVAAVPQSRSAGFLSLLTNQVFLPPNSDNTQVDEPEDGWGIPIIQFSSEGSEDERPE